MPAAGFLVRLLEVRGSLAMAGRADERLHRDSPAVVVRLSESAPDPRHLRLLVAFLDECDQPSDLPIVVEHNEDQVEGPVFALEVREAGRRGGGPGGAR
jgi:hypothetical protein